MVRAVVLASVAAACLLLSVWLRRSRGSIRRDGRPGAGAAARRMPVLTPLDPAAALTPAATGAFVAARAPAAPLVAGMFEAKGAPVAAAAPTAPDTPAAPAAARRGARNSGASHFRPTAWPGPRVRERHHI